MSEVTGPPGFKSLEPVSRVPEINRHDQKPADQKPDQEQEQKLVKQKELSDHLSRDPAVSLSASVGHIALGEDISGAILSIDSDRRPILVTKDATFALTPDVGLKEGDSITLNIITTDHTLKAELIIRNGKPEVPPVTLTLTLISVKQVPHGVINNPSVGTRYIDNQTGAYIPPSTAPYLTESSPQTSLSSGIYQQYAASKVDWPHEPKDSKLADMSTIAPSVYKGALRDNITAETKQLNDPTMIKSSSIDMAALLIAQQVSGSIPTSPIHSQAIEKPTENTQVPTAKSEQSAPITQQGAIRSSVEQSSKNIVIDSNTAPAAAFVPIPTVYSEGEIAKETPVFTQEKVQTPLQSSASIVEHEVVQKETASNPGIDRPPSSEVSTNTDAVPTNYPILPAHFMPSEAAQTLLTKANISVTQPSTAVRVILRAKQNNDPPNAIDVKIQSIQQLPQQMSVPTNGPLERQAEKRVDVPAQTSATSPNSQDEIKARVHIYQIETTGGTIKVSLPDGEPLPLLDSSIAIIPSALAVSHIPQTGPLTKLVAPLNLLSKGLDKWPALQKIHELITMEQLNKTFVPSIIQQISNALQSRTAGGGPHLANSLLFMMSALRQGDGSGWLSPKIVQYLEQTDQKPLLDILKKDIQRFANLINRPASGEWQPIVLPLAADDNSQLLALLVRPEKQDKNENNQDKGDDENGGESKESPTRFILEVHLSQVGNIQLDGYIKDKNFDLKFKSLLHIDEGMKHDIRQLFTNALDVSGYSGSITFHQSTIFLVNVTDIINKAEPHSHETHNA